MRLESIGTKRVEDISDDHIDALARFTSLGVVLLSEKREDRERYEAL